MALIQVHAKVHRSQEGASKGMVTGQLTEATLGKRIDMNGVEQGFLFLLYAPSGQPYLYSAIVVKVRSLSYESEN